MIHFVVHSAQDSVGVVVVEGIHTGQALTGWIMDVDRTLQIESEHDIPIGHKLALVDIASGDTVVKYGHDIGRAIAPIQRGEHVHVHNLKTTRW